MTTTRELAVLEPDVADRRQTEGAGGNVPGVTTGPLTCERCEAPDPIVAACPYRSEISGNETPCTCCRSCRHGCAMDI